MYKAEQQWFQHISCQKWIDEFDMREQATTFSIWNIIPYVDQTPKYSSNQRLVMPWAVGNAVILAWGSDHCILKVCPTAYNKKTEFTWLLWVYRFIQQKADPWQV